MFVDGEEVTGIVDWTEAGHGDPMHDLAILTLVSPPRTAARRSPNASHRRGRSSNRSLSVT